MEQINIDYLAKHLFTISIQNGSKISYEDAEQICAHMIELLGISDEHQKLLNQYALTEGYYCIDAQTMMYSLGVLNGKQDAYKVQRILERRNIIPKGVDFKAPPVGGTLNQSVKIQNSDEIISENEEVLLFQNTNCKVIQQKVKKNGKTYLKNKYFISRNACYKVLVRAYDDDKFADYFSIKWQISEQYKQYASDYAAYLEKQSLEASNRIKDDKIDTLLAEVKDQSQKIDNLTKMNTNQSQKIDKQSAQIDRLLGHAERSEEKIDHLNKKIDVLFDFMLSFARMTISTWIGSSVMKTQLNKLTTGKSLSYGLKHMKVMFVVSFYKPYEKARRVMIDDKKISYRALMKHYFCCTNFADVGARIKELNKRHEEDYYMLEPQAICLISCEINTERVTLSSMRHLFPEDANVTYLDKYKAFDVEITTRLYSKISNIYDTMVDKSRKERFQMYQTRMDEYISSQSFNENILNHINEADEIFYESTLPFCQNYINCYLAKSVDEDDNFIEWTYHVSPKNSNVKTRKDLGNKRVNNLVYPLHKIKSIIDNYSETDDIGEMVKTGIICKNDIESMKAIAKIENVDISHVQFPVEEDY